MDRSRRRHATVVVIAAVVAWLVTCVGLGFWQLQAALRTGERGTPRSNASERATRAAIAAVASGRRESSPTSPGRRLRGASTPSMRCSSTGGPSTAEPGLSLVTPLVLKTSNTIRRDRQGWVPFGDTSGCRSPTRRAPPGSEPPIDRVPRPPMRETARRVPDGERCGWPESTYGGIDSSTPLSGTPAADPADRADAAPALGRLPDPLPPEELSEGLHISCAIRGSPSPPSPSAEPCILLRRERRSPTADL